MDPIEDIAKKSDPTRWEKIKAFTELATVTISIIALAFSVWFSSQASLAANKAQEASQKANKETQELSAKAQDAMNLHNEQSVRPFLDFKYKFGIGITGRTEGGKTVAEKQGYLRLANVGTGIAEITKIQATFEGKPIGTSAAELRQLITENLKGNDEIAPSKLKIEQPISPNDYVNILVITQKGATDATSVCRKDYERKKFASRLRIAVEYKSNYQKFKTAVFEYEPPPNECK